VEGSRRRGEGGKNGWSERASAVCGSTKLVYSRRTRNRRGQGPRMGVRQATRQGVWWAPRCDGRKRTLAESHPTRIARGRVRGEPGGATSGTVGSGRRPCGSNGCGRRDKASRQCVDRRGEGGVRRGDPIGLYERLSGRVRARGEHGPPPSRRGRGEKGPGIGGEERGRAAGAEGQ
jgi:hypothetical protein